MGCNEDVTEGTAAHYRKAAEELAASSGRGGQIPYGTHNQETPHRVGLLYADECEGYAPEGSEAPIRGINRAG